jgi:RHS repeat-associated protein
MITPGFQWVTIARRLGRAVHLSLLVGSLGCMVDPEAVRQGEPFGSTALIANTTANQAGRLTSTGAGAVRIFNQYDLIGRNPVVQRVADNVSYVFRASYGYPRTALGLCAGNSCNSPGPLGTVTTASAFPDGEVVSFGYDASGLPQTVSTQRCADAAPHTDASCTTLAAAEPVVVSQIRNSHSRITQLVLGNGTEQDTCFNDGTICAGAAQPNTDARLNRIRTIVQTTGAALQDYTYTFQANGLLAKVTDAVCTALGGSYGYDSLGRLTSMTPAAGGVALNYAYDDAGNLTSKEGSVQTYGGAGRGPHALAAAGGLAYSYDANGNLASRSDGLTFSWNAENMPVASSGGAASVVTRKSFLGASLWKKVQGLNTTLYLPGMRIENGLARKYFGPFAERDTDGTLKFHHQNQLDSVVLVTDSTARVIYRADHLPYGGDQTLSSCPAFTQTFTPRYQYTSQEKEGDGTGFYDYGARLYNPATGRWLSPDQSSNDGYNRYAYVRDNPLRYTDPTGRQSKDTQPSALVVGVDGQMVTVPGISQDQANWIQVNSDIGTLHYFGNTPGNLLNLLLNAIASGPTPTVVVLREYVPPLFPAQNEVQARSEAVTSLLMILVTPAIAELSTAVVVDMTSTSLARSVIIGEDMVTRVVPYSQAAGASNITEWMGSKGFAPEEWSPMLQNLFTSNMYRDALEDASFSIIDIGRSPSRIAAGVPMSIWYETEVQLLGNVPGYQPPPLPEFLFEVSGPPPTLAPPE